MTSPEQRLADADAVMWRMERHDARFRAVIAVLAVLERSPGIEALTARADLFSRLLPRFRCRVAPPDGPWAPPRWEIDDELDLSHHVRAVGAPGAGTLDDVAGLAGPMTADGLDPSRPPWQMTLVEGMAGGRAGLLLRLHHAYADGVGLAQLAAVLFDLAADAPAPALPAQAEGNPVPRWRRWGADMGDELGRAVALGRRATPLVGGLLRDAVVAPEGAATRTLALARSLARTAAPTARACSPIMTGRSTHAVLGHIAVRLSDVRDAGRPSGATVNDVYVSTVVEGLRRYHAKHGSRPDRLRIGMPINLRPSPPAGTNGPLGNQFWPTRMLVPLQLEDPADRLGAIHRLVAEERSQAALGAHDALAAIANRLGGSLVPLMGAALASADLIVSNVPGSAAPLYLAGVRVLQLWPFGPRSGAGLNVTAASYGDTLHVGVNMDPAATPDTATLLACLCDAFAEVVVYA